MAVQNRPVIFLAFANDRVDDAAYLRNLPKELDGIRKALYRAQEAGLCEVVERANVTVENILNVFQDQRYRDRIAIFHYGGHANGYQLLLEAVDGTNVSAKSEGLVPFFAKQRSLKLIFLNGCSSQQQALDLIEAGLPAVIGTSQSINDDIATKLAIRFYNGLGNGAGIDKAWQEAVDEVKIQKGTANMRDLFFEGMVQEENPQQSNVIDRFPWEVYYKSGAEIVKAWNLPEQVGNPLFNLPEIPKRHNLPESPFLFLKRYERKHARVFFGRSYYIRDLYNKITDVSSPPIILLYGQSGVGKSSLFDAGIYPRLEESHNIKYIRRDGELGLVNGLKRVLEIEEELIERNRENIDNQVSEEQDDRVEEVDGEKASEEIQLTSEAESEMFLKSLEEKVADLQGEVKAQTQSLIEALKRKLDADLFEQEMGGLAGRKIASESEIQHLTGLLKKWRTIEARTGKPLVIILDQVEELFTRPIASQPRELDDLLKVFDQLFANPVDFPRGKIIMGYRKEFNPEIEEGFKVHSLPRTKIFLDHLSRKDIVDIFRGLSETPALQDRYKLTVEEELPVIIADDLLEDKNSSVAPVLQILLTKMWAKALAANAEEPAFTVDLYQGLRREGILLDDFYFQQMEKLRQWAMELEMSGFALSVLQFHTTRLGTAGSRHIDEIRERYKHREEDLDGLIEKFKELYLLNESGRAITGLAHDTIAPLIQNEYRVSERPGQRAARILENKSLELKSNQKTALDVVELDLVEEGQAGMRYWADREWELVEKSRVLREKMKKRKRQAIRAAIATTILILMTTVYSIWQSGRSQKLLKELAVVGLAEKAKTTVKTDPTFSLSMAKKYHDAASSGEYSSLMNDASSDKNASDQLLTEILKQSSGQRLYNSVLFISKRRPIQSVAFSSSEKLVVTTTTDNLLSAWGIDGKEEGELHRSLNKMKTAVFSDDSIKLVFNDGNVRVMDNQGDTYRRSRKKKIDPIWTSKDHSIWLYSSAKQEYSRRSYEHTCIALDLFFKNFKTNKHFEVNLAVLNTDITLDPCHVTAAKSDGSLLAFKYDLGYDSLYDEQLYGLGILNTSKNEFTRLTSFDRITSNIGFHPSMSITGVLDPNSNNFYVLNDSLEIKNSFTLKEGLSVDSWEFVPEKEQVAFLLSDQSIVFYKFNGDKELELIEDSYAEGRFGFSPSGRYCYKIGAYEEGVHIWDLEHEQPLLTWESDQWLSVFGRKVSTNARFSSDGKYIIERLPSDSLMVQDWRANQVVSYLPPIDSLASVQLFYHENGMLGHLSNYEDMVLMLDENTPMLYGSPDTITTKVLGVTLSSTGKRLYIGHAHQIKVVSEAGMLIDSLNLLEHEESGVDQLNMKLAVSKDDKTLLVARGSEFEVYDLENKSHIYTGVTAWIDRVAISDDGTSYAILSDSKLALWNSSGMLDSKLDSAFKKANDIQFALDNDHIHVFTSKGVYLWGSSRMLGSLIGQLGLDNPSLKLEIHELLNERDIIRGVTDPLLWKRVFFMAMLSILGWILLNQTTIHFDHKLYMKVAFYAPVFGLLIIFQAYGLLLVETTREDHHTDLDGLMMINAPFFFYLAFTWYRKLKYTNKLRSNLYLLAVIGGGLGLVYFLYEDYYSFFKLDFWEQMGFWTIALAVLLVPTHLAVRFWYKQKKRWFWVFATIVCLEMFFVLLMMIVDGG